MQTKQQTKSQKIKLLKRFLKQEKLNKAEVFRTQAVLLRIQGYSRQQISQITNRSISAIATWITTFNQKGVNGLRSKKTKSANNFKLSQKQKQKIKKLINQKSPQQLGLKEVFWTINTLKELVYHQFKAKYKSNRSYQRLFKYCGFTYQKVQEQDSRQNQEEQTHFKTRLRKKLKKGVLTISW